MKNPKLLFLVLLTIALSAVALIWFVYQKDSISSPNTSGKIKIEGFVRTEVSCQALIPSCGYCPGEVIEGACYLTQAEFDEYKKIYSDLKASD